MQEQNFEKQVQQTMEELSFVPSEPVWQKVEGQIRRKKDRRRLIFWVLPFLLLGGGYFILSRTNDAAIQDKTEATVSTTPGEEDDNTVTKNETEINQKPVEHKQSISKGEIVGAEITKGTPQSFKTKKGGKAESIIIEKKRTSLVEDDEVVRLADEKPVTNKVAASKTKQTDEVRITAVEKKAAEIVANDVSVSNKDEKQNDAVVTNTDTKPEAVLTKDSVDAVAQPPAATQPASQKTDSLAGAADSSNVVKSIQLKHKWLVSFKATVGVSTLSDKLNPFGSIVSAEEKSASNLYADRAPVQSSVNFSNAAASPVITLPPSPVYKYFSYSVGIDVRKKIRNRLELVTGLQYNYFSTWQYIGNRVDNRLASRNNLSAAISSQSFYLNSSIIQTKHVTKYHFISVPLGLDYQLSKHKPFKLSFGVEAAQLLSTNALYYDKAAAVYYQKESLFRNTQLFGTTALTYRLLNKKFGALDLGPQVQFGFTNLLAKKSDGKQHLIAAGLVTRFSL